MMKHVHNLNLEVKHYQFIDPTAKYLQEQIIAQGGEGNEAPSTDPKDKSGRGDPNE